MSKRFSFWEVLISSLIILVLFAILIGSVGVLFRTNSTLKSLATRKKCTAETERLIAEEFSAAQKVFAVVGSGEKLQLKKIDDLHARGIGLVSGQNLKVFVKKKNAEGLSEYFYELYNLNSENFDETKPIADYTTLASTQNLFAKSCEAKGADEPFTLKLISKYRSSEKAVLLEASDVVRSSDQKESILFIRLANAFR